MNQTHLVSFDIAKKLKSTGFQKPSLFMYDLNGELNEHFCHINQPRASTVSAPKFLDVVDWLYTDKRILLTFGVKEDKNKINILEKPTILKFDDFNLFWEVFDLKTGLTIKSESVKTEKGFKYLNYSDVLNDAINYVCKYMLKS